MIEEQHEVGVYPKRDVVIVRGEGAHLWDDEGNRYIDCAGGHGIANLGHCNSYVVKAIEEQCKRLISCPEIFYNDVRASLLKKLAEITPAGLTRFFLCNSGTESVEGALKFARFFTKRKSIIATMRAFHGRTFGALSATWSEKYTDPFKPLVPEFFHVPYNRIEAMEERVNELTAAVIVEIIQGEGGVVPGDTEYFKALRKMCDDTGALLIFDEVQTGFGRTGTLFACEYHGVVPDIMCVAKSMGGGIPIGAVCVHERLGTVSKSAHGSTFGGNPLACSAALGAIRYIEEKGLVEHSREMGNYFMDKLRDIKSPLIRCVRGRGLMIGLELKSKSFEFVRKLVPLRVLALPAGTIVLRFLPPLVIEKEDIDFVVEQVEKVLT